MNPSDRLIVGQFLERKSSLHILDPRTKLIGFLLFMIVVMLLDTKSGYIAATLFVFIVLQLSRIPLTLYIRGLMPLLPVVLLTLLYHLLWGQGIGEGIRIFWRILLMVLPASALTATTRPLQMAQGIETLLKPLSKLRVPVEQFALMIVIAIRFIPTILEDIQRIRLARKARGFQSKRNLLSPMIEFIQILVPLLISTVRRADQLTLAIEARAYGDGRGRTVFRRLLFKKPDALATLLIVLSLSIIFAIDMLFPY
ncbi:energy-coupling factor transporter transmembrane protein EcfT [Saccharibacillus sp. JS10]|uniref:energy-coupling factor transporter transmembrane component T family protein n=1 Tax=Saccharibacillus sp. JS10 TaxID=2950552 RepID=UPI002108EC19|nr:energy-coupling factor transporter transmembrane component T [Saccharibacillus sp. JS10]MCQ4085474.1 energy-coupling factor transporter transmembrane protein EcfT [Saccharibacillus sp. JS10]